MDISFIILNYKSRGLLKNCLRSLVESDMDGLQYEVIVVDNASHDGVRQMLEQHFSGVTFIQSRRNLGMGAGNNLGLRHARGRYVAIVNPDTMALAQTFRRLYNFMETHPRVGLAGPQLINPDRSLQYTRCRYHTFFIPVYRRTPLQRLASVQHELDKFLTKDQDYFTAQAADWLFGACFFARRDVAQSVGFFDERFFLGFEDTDFCRRIWQAGYEVWYYPDSVMIHYPHRFSSDQNWLASIFNPNVRIHIASWLKYFWKWGLTNAN